MDPFPSRFHVCEDYTIGWVCALPVEERAAVYMLEKRHRDLLVPTHNGSAYILGNIGQHNIVIVALPKGRVGNIDAAIVATRMVSTFPNIRSILLVGVGSEIPEKVRLGDIVVSYPSGTQSGVVEWDKGIATAYGNEPLSRQSWFMPSPPTVLLAALVEFEAKGPENRSKMIQTMKNARIEADIAEEFMRPGFEEDLLFEADYDHVDRDSDNCQKCDQKRIIQRPPRENVTIHYGLIASGNKVVRDAKLRDYLYKSHKDNILCIVTQAAGLMNASPGIVIRGIENYADSHSNKRWQKYAAMIAAAFARTLPVINIDTRRGTFTSSLRSVPTTIVEDHAEYGSSNRAISNPPAIQLHIEIQHVYIAVMGVTGAGKSSLISMCTGKIVRIGTTDVKDIAFMLNDRICVHLIDTPGFDDTFRSDVQVLQDLAHWFSKSFEGGTRLSGMIYLHRITDVRMTGSARRNLIMFQKLCGENAYSSVVLATTMWGLVEKATGEQRERELVESDEYWGYMHNKGSRVFRLAQTRRSCLEIIRHILSLDSTVVLELQDEIVNQGHQIEETKAGLQLNEDILHERERYQADLQAMKEQMQETMALNNAELQRIFREEHDKLEENIRLKEEEQAKFKQDLKEVQARKDYEFEEFKRQLADMEHARKRYDDNNRRMEDFLNSNKREAYKELINGNHMEVYQTQGKEEELLRGDQKEDYTSPPNKETKLVKQNETELEKQNGVEMINGKQKDVYKPPQSEEEELSNGGHKEVYISPSDTHISYDEGNIASGDTPLHTAIWNRKPDVVKALVGNGGNIKFKDKHGNTPLHLASITGQTNITQMLLDQGVDISERNNNYNTPLHLAIQNEQIDTARLLLHRRADIEMSDNQDNTPFHLAAWSGREGIAKLLLEWGAEIEVKNKSGYTPLHLSVQNERMDTAKLLLDRQAEIEIRDNQNNTPLHFAAMSGRESIAKLLLEWGATMEAKNKSGHTPLHLAALNGKADVVKLLRKGGADVEVKDIDGNTPLHLASMAGKMDVTRLLLGQTNRWWSGW